MFKRKLKTDTNLQELINSAQSQLDSHDVDSDEYGAALEKLERLYKLKAKETEQSRISPDTLVMVAANLLGIVLILNHERIHVVTSKALSFVVKTKV